MKAMILSVALALSLLGCTYGKTMLVVGSEREAAGIKKLLPADEQVEVNVGSNIMFKKHGVPQFQNLILFGIEKDIPPRQLLDFVDSNGNLMMIGKAATSGDSGLPDDLRDAAIECGVLFSDTNVEDSKHNSGKKDSITVVDFTKSRPILNNQSPKSLNYKGLGLQLEKNNPLLHAFATAQESAVAPAEDEDEGPSMIGSSIAIAAGLQTRQGSRILFAGSTDLFNAKGEEGKFAQSIVEWTLGRRGQLRHSEVKFDKKEGDHTGLRIKDWIDYSVKIEESVNGKWVPFKSDDVQLEFTMIDPWVRQGLKYDEKKNDGTYTVSFQAPDWYGIFKFHVDYRRSGYTLLEFSDQSTIRPLRLNEYPRFIASAYPYYLGVFSAAAAFFLFTVMVLNA